jgi:hypothetical protein
MPGFCSLFNAGLVEEVGSGVVQQPAFTLALMLIVVYATWA